MPNIQFDKNYSMCVNHT